MFVVISSCRSNFWIQLLHRVLRISPTFLIDMSQGNGTTITGMRISQVGRNILTAVYVVYARAVAVQETLEKHTSRSTRRGIYLHLHLKH